MTEYRVNLNGLFVPVASLASNKSVVSVRFRSGGQRFVADGNGIRFDDDSDAIDVEGVVVEDAPALPERSEGRA